MINATDLRLGNFVFDIERGEIATVIGIESDRVQLKPSPYVWTSCEKIEGVKISPEWLKEYKFKKLSYGDYILDNICPNRYGKKQYELAEIKGGYRYDGIKGKSKYLCFLRELQNSYKEIENEELKMTK